MMYCVVILLLLCATVAAVEDWQPKNYVAGTQVCRHGKVYRAKWWANPHQDPAAHKEFEWSSPWAEVAGASCSGGGKGKGVEPSKLPPPQIPSPSVKPPPVVTPSATPPAGKGKGPGGKGKGGADRGEWVEGTAYAAFDNVTWRGKPYQCKPPPYTGWCKTREPNTNGGNECWCHGKCSADGSGPETATTPPPPRDGTPIARAEVEAEEARLVSAYPMIGEYRKQLRMLDNAQVEAIVPGRAENPDNVKRVESIVSAERWNYFYPLRHEVYTYENLLRAIGKFPAYCGLVGGDADRSITLCRKSLATSFAHFVQETSGNSPDWERTKGVELWRQGLYYIREKGYTEETKNAYIWSCQDNTFKYVYRCVAGRSYFGRGAKQLSHAYNYGPYSRFMFSDTQHLLANPGLVASTWLGLCSAVWFFMMPQPPKPSMQSVIDGLYQPNAVDRAANLLPGFGLTINIINGGYECGKPAERADHRVAYYRKFAEYLAVPIPADEMLGCRTMGKFGPGSSSAVAFFIGKSERGHLCVMSTWDQGFSLLTPGDYERCVLHFNPRRPIE
eukprot:Filipodium_phascolosomae@DN2707_c0_g1_i3.p1